MVANIDYTKFRLSLERLEEQYNNYQNLDESLSTLNQEAIAESAIQRFETCFDTLWKTLKKYMTEALGLPDLPNSPKPLFRIAYGNQLFRGSLEDWIQYSDSRIETSHDYDSVKAQHCLRIIDGFIEDAVGLYQTMTGESWD